MMDKRKAAEIILEEMDQHAPVIINHNQDDLWIGAILRGLTKADLAENAKPQERQLPGNQSNL